MVMDRAAGRPALPGLDGGLTPATVPRLLRQIPGCWPDRWRGCTRSTRTWCAASLSRSASTAVTVPGLVAALAQSAAEFGRPDLVGAARWLADHPPAPAPDVICHGDLHPFNLLADGDRVTVLDWSNALLAPRAYDVAFTSLLLSEPPLRVPGWQRPLRQADQAGCWPTGSSAATGARPGQVRARRAERGTRPWSACARSSRWPAGCARAQTVRAPDIRG